MSLPIFSHWYTGTLSEKYAQKGEFLKKMCHNGSIPIHSISADVLNLTHTLHLPKGRVQKLTSPALIRWVRVHNYGFSAQLPEE